MANLIPPPLTYPGVYVVEVPKGGGRTVTPAPTSITAFLGRAVMGPVNQPTTITSWGDYQSLFGGLASGFTLPRAVQDFFNNGGGQAVIVRLVHVASAPDPSSDTETGGSVVLAATRAAVKVGDDNAAVLKAAQTAAANLTGDQKVVGDAIVDVMKPILEKATPAQAAALSAGSAKFVEIAVALKSSPTLSPEQEESVLVAADAVAAHDPPTAESLAAMTAVLTALYRDLNTESGKAATVSLPSGTILQAMIAASGQSDGSLRGASRVLTEMVAASLKSSDARSVLSAGKARALALTDPEERAGGTTIAFDPSLAQPKTASALLEAAVAIFERPITRLSAAERTWLAVRAASELDSTVAHDVVSTLGRLVAGDDERAARALGAQGTVGDRLSSMLTASPSAASAIPTVLAARNVGTWGNLIKVSVTYSQDTDIPDEVLAAINQSGPPGTNVTRKNLFNIAFALIPPGSTNVATESFVNVTLVPGTSATLKTVLEQQSQYVSFVSGPNDGSRPAETNNPLSFTGGLDSALLADDDYKGSELDRTGIYALDNAEVWNLLCIPPDTALGDIGTPVWQKAITYSAKNRGFVIIDPPVGWATTLEKKGIGALRQEAQSFITDLGGGSDQRNAMLYFPRLLEVNPLTGNTESFVGCGAITGVMARTDVARGVWKAPAGTEATLNQIAGLQFVMDDTQNGQLNPIAVNALRTFPIYGSVIWGSRTLRGSNQLSDEYMYVPVRRLANFIEDSLQSGTKWAVFEPNDATLWASLKQTINTFMNGLKNQGAFYSYFVQVDATTTTADDIARGVVNVLIGFAPVQPAEFVVLYFQQIAGQTAS